MSSLVDQFLDDDSEQEEQTKQNPPLNNNTASTKSLQYNTALAQKQSLHNLKKKYNFYDDDDSSSSSASNHDHQEEDDVEPHSNQKTTNNDDDGEEEPYQSHQKQRDDVEDEEGFEQSNIIMGNSVVFPVRDEVNVRVESSHGKRIASLSKFLRDTGDNKLEDSQLCSSKNDDEEEGSINDYKNFEEDFQEDEEDKQDSQSHTKKHFNGRSSLLNHQELLTLEGHRITRHSQLQNDSKLDESDLDLYQLSDGCSSIPKGIDASSAKKDCLRKSSIEDNESILEQSIRQAPPNNFDLTTPSDSRKMEILPKPMTQAVQSEMGQTEMTFGDLTSNSSDITFYESKSALMNKEFHQVQLSQSQGINRKLLLTSGYNNATTKQSVIKEEVNEEAAEDSQSSQSLEYSQITLAQSMGMQGFNPQTSNRLQRMHQPLNLNMNFMKSDQVQLPSTQYLQSEDKPVQSQKNRQRQQILKHILTQMKKKMIQAAFIKLREYTIKATYQTRLTNAATMVDKMSKFSRSFISLNSLSQIIIKNNQRSQAKSFYKWFKYSMQKNSSPNILSKKSNPSSVAQENSQQTLVIQQQAIQIKELEKKLVQKDQEIQKMESMFHEYSSWRSKLEQIEVKMKADVEFWRQNCDKLQRENEKLQKEIHKQSQQLMEKTKEMELQKSLIDKLQKNKQSIQTLDTVEEVLCSNCKNSLEESQIFTARLSQLSHRDHQQQKDNQAIDQQTESLIRELSERLNDLERQVLTYRERVSYHESVEEELKKNIESQVDVVLKMEEERLLLLKETKETRDRNRTLAKENEDFRSRISLFEKELEELQLQIKEQMRAQQQQEMEAQSESESVVSQKENKNSNNINKKGFSKAIAGKATFKKATTTLKFQPAISKAGTVMDVNQAISTSIVSSIQSTQGFDAKSSSLTSDNQILTQELVTLNREVSKLKAELRSIQDLYKKSEKERLEGAKSLQAKDNALEKLRKERDELWAVVNTDKYKNLRTAEQERERAEKQRNELESQVAGLREEVAKVQDRIKEMELVIQEKEFSLQKAQEREASREKLLTVLEEKSQKLQKELSLNEQLSSTAKQEADLFKQENAKLKQDVEWLANSARNNKTQAERAINDLEAYTKILRGMEKHLIEAEVERESKEVELRDLRQKLMIITLQQQQQPMMLQTQTQQPSQFHQQQPMGEKPQNWAPQNVTVKSPPSQHSSQQPVLMSLQHQQWIIPQPQMQSQQQQIPLPQRNNGVPQPQQPPQRFA